MVFVENLQEFWYSGTNSECVQIFLSQQCVDSEKFIGNVKKEESTKRQLKFTKDCIQLFEVVLIQNWSLKMYFAHF